MKPDSLKIELIQEQYREGYHQAVDLVARERKYLARPEAPPIADAEALPWTISARGTLITLPLYLEGLSVGEGFSHCGSLGMGVTEGYRGRGIGFSLIEAKGLGRDCFV